MPSPFPGMDPYLEEPGLWPDVHLELISAARELLNIQLLPKYYARVEDRVYISDEHDPGRRVIAPDPRVARTRSNDSIGMPAGEVAGMAAATVEPLEVTTLIEDEIHEPRVEVIDRFDRTVVAVIEILSPANKVASSRSRASYEQKREEVMRPPSHFIEIDLLRAGEGFPPYESLPPHDYRVHLSRIERRPRGLLWPIRLEQRLPSIRVPLRGDDPDARLDLQSVLDTAYRRASYEAELDYRAPAPGPLSAEQEAWIDRLLRERGLR
jgi:hypothetical protein